MGGPSHSRAQATPAEDLFRRLNERLDDLSRFHADPAPPRTEPLQRLVCECAQRSCSRLIELAGEEFRGVRARPRCFIVFPDPAHVNPDAEKLVLQHERYWVVEKLDSRGERDSPAEGDAGPL